MRASPPPPLDSRRKAEFLAELIARARAWIPSWSLADGEGDFGRALLEVAARFNAEVAERLDHAGEKLKRGLLDWLAVRGEAARPARVPVAFKLADSAKEPVLATHPARMQAAAGDASVIFETAADLQIVPGRLDLVVGADADADAYYLPAPGLSDLGPIDPAPTEWRLKSFAAAGARRLQLDPDSGLAADMIILAGGQEYRVVAADKDIVTIDPPLATDLALPALVQTVSGFAPFDGTARNRQAHAVYLGDTDLFNLEAAATIDVVGAQGMRTGIDWQYWGKRGDGQESDWQALEPADDDEQKSDALVLKKGKGAVDPLQLGAANGRWLRGYTKIVTGAPVQVDALQVRINCTDASADPPSPDASPAVEAMANTTPLVLNSAFFPLGKEPRQFDAFYLGSAEAFSKKGADVTLQFDLADPTFAALAAVHTGIFAEGVLAGVAKDRALHLFSVDGTTGAITNFRDREALQPPVPGFAGNVASDAAGTVALDSQPTWRPPTWSQQDFVASFPPLVLPGFLVAVSAGDAIWVWHEHPAAPGQSGWIEFGALPPTTTTPRPSIEGLVYLADPSAPGTGTMFALRHETMYARTWPNGAQWTEVATHELGIPVALKSIVPVLVPDATTGQLATSTTAGMVGISGGNDLYTIRVDGGCTKLTLLPAVDSAVQPVAIQAGGQGDNLVAAVEFAAAPALVAQRTSAQPQNWNVDLGPGATKVVGGLDVKLVGGTPYILASIDDGGSGRIASWAPDAGTPLDAEFESLVTGGGQVGGSPTVAGSHVVVPGRAADILVDDFDPSRRIVQLATVQTAIIVPESTPTLAVNDTVLRDGAPPDVHFVTQTGRTNAGETLYPIDSGFQPGQPSPILVYPSASALQGKYNGSNHFKLDATDQETDDQTLLLIDGTLYRVNGPPAAGGIATIAPMVAGGPMPSVAMHGYIRPVDSGGRAAPFLRLDPATNGNWNADLLRRVPLVFPEENPKQEPAEAFVTNGGKPVIVVLANPFQPPIVSPTKFVLDLAFGAWQQQFGETPSNPQLSWEYSNGKGWSALDVRADETLNLKQSGDVKFTVPPDIAPSDWAGKTDVWIRARLIGGDYGREEVTVTIKDLGGGVSQQTVDRSSEGIRPPVVVSLSISYSVCASVTPAYVLTDDSGSRRDQSDANRTPGAIVEAFVPLAVTLGRLSGAPAQPAATPAAPALPAGAGCACGCGDVATPGGGSAASATAPAATGRGLYLGLTVPPSDGPVRVLLLVQQERPYAELAPLIVDALVSNGFVPVVSDDATRAAGESGLVTMSFTLPPTPRDLFGRSLAWLRLGPGPGGSAAAWKPALKGVYLNAVWAGATETLTRELVGSSDGAPGLTFTLARPPLLRDTLELRVKEPLGDEERTQLLEQNPQSVLSDVSDLPGDWVLWTRVVDPGDEDPGARVYALDEQSGQITFGDGQHGKIPPIGRDGIVAFSYQRTEPAPPGSTEVPGNLITPRTTLNLVSPIATVESVIAADQAAGGAPPESNDRVVRFGGARLRHRERALTPEDLEDIALESSPQIVQARCLLRTGAVRLVVVMRGKDPRPDAAQARELRRLLLAAGPSALSAAGALIVDPPALRRLRIHLDLSIDRLDHVGALNQSVKERLAAFFDTATGGAGRDGWQLGDSPAEADIAYALADIPYLQSIAGVTLIESRADGSEGPWPAALKSTELAALADDPILVHFTPIEEAA